MLSLCCSTLYALKCYVPYTTTLSNLLYIWWMARVLLLPWYSFGRRPQGCLSLITRTTSTKQHTCLQNFVAKWVDWNCLNTVETFIKSPVKTSASIAVRRLALNGQRGIRSAIFIMLNKMIFISLHNTFIINGDEKTLLNYTQLHGLFYLK